MTSLLRTSAESQKRILTRLGGAAVLCLVIATALGFAVNPFGRSQKDLIAVSIDTPYAGQGVTKDTPVTIHGVKVGQVTSVSNLSTGGVRLGLVLQSRPTTGLTDTMGVDFRPANYFGVTGINLIPGKNGRPLYSGAHFSVTPKGNFALQALLSRLGELSDKVITHQLVSVFDRATRYTDGLDPLLETMMIAGTAVTNVQTVSTEKLLRNTTGVSVAFPGIVDALVHFGDRFLRNVPAEYTAEKQKDFETNRYFPFYVDELKKYSLDGAKLLGSDRDRFWKDRFVPLLHFAASDLFGKAGDLLKSHSNDLLPLIDDVTTVTNVVPGLVSAERFGDTLRELRSRLEHMYEGSGDQRAMQVRIILDSLPGVAAPIDLAMGGRQ
jgi:MlaD protein